MKILCIGLLLALVMAGQIAGDTLHVLAPGEDIFTLAKQHQTTWEHIALCNQIACPKEPTHQQVLLIPSPHMGSGPLVCGMHIYTVQFGDTLERIAHRHHITVQAIRDLNASPFTTPYLGQRILLPREAPRTQPGDAIIQVTQEKFDTLSQMPSVDVLRFWFQMSGEELTNDWRAHQYGQGFFAMAYWNGHLQEFIQAGDYQMIRDYFNHPTMTITYMAQQLTVNVAAGDPLPIFTDFIAQQILAHLATHIK